ncbi:MAG: sugar phosphate isomerase/epimerase family protein [Bryobacter sp.]|nr:sugar phosphate isomerase/epimerase family protein [Bryobacter sp.]
MTFRHAICNEAFEKWDFAEQCRTMKRLGYEGIEIAPFTLGAAPDEVSQERRRELKDIIASEGLRFVGLHWLLVGPKNIHVTTPDEATRTRSWNYVRRLVDLCADLGPAGVMVFGSPKQRSSVDGLSSEEATKNLVDGFRFLAPHAEERGVRVLLEALPQNQTDVLLSLAEAVEYVKEINSPFIRTMFDTHNAVDEQEPHAVLIDRYFEFIEHVHVNETDGSHCGWVKPGAQAYDFVPVLQALAKRGYNGWVSLEAFDFTPGAEELARQSMEYLTEKIAEAGLA